MDAGSLKTRQTQLELGWLIKVPQQSSEQHTQVITPAYKFFVRWGLDPWVLSAHADNTQITVLCLVLSSLFRLLSYLNILSAYWLKLWKDLGCEIYFFFFLIFNASCVNVAVCYLCPFNIFYPILMQQLLVFTLSGDSEMLCVEIVGTQ